MIRLALAFSLLAAPALAADTTFNRADIEAAYAMGRADALQEATHTTPEAKQLTEKLKPASPPQPAPKDPKK